jgi:hypothetical protein
MAASSFFPLLRRVRKRMPIRSRAAMFSYVVSSESNTSMPGSLPVDFLWDSTKVSTSSEASSALMSPLE